MDRLRHSIERKKSESVDTKLKAGKVPTGALSARAVVNSQEGKNKAGEMAQQCKLTPLL